jgi:hypothetical protein
MHAKDKFYVGSVFRGEINNEMTSRIHLTEEEVYDIFRNVFHNEEDALAGTLQLFRGDPISWDEDYE